MHAIITSTPARGLAELCGRIVQTRRLSWPAAREEVAAAAGIASADLAEVERGTILTAGDLARLRSAAGLVERFDPGAIGYRAAAELAGAVVRADGDAATRYRFVMSTGNPDRAHDIVEQDWDLSGFARNPIAPLNHASWALPIGRWHDVGIVGGALQGDLECYRPSSADLHRDAVVTAEMLASGFLRAASVGFMPRRMFARSSLDPKDPRYNPRGYVFADNELLECSVVTVPMNADATMSAESAPKRGRSAPAAVAPGVRWGARS